MLQTMTELRPIVSDHNRSAQNRHSSMSTQFRSLPGHARRVRIVGIVGGVLLLSGAVLLGIGQEPAYKSLLRYGGGFALTGAAVMILARFLVRYARCPTCGALLTQGDRGDNAKYGGVFVCRSCNVNWLTSERSKMDAGIG